MHDKEYLKDVTRYVGTSSGSILSLLMIVGYEPIDILVYLCVNKAYSKMSTFSVSNLVLLGGSLVKFEPIEKTVEDMVVDKMGFVPTMKELSDVTGRSLVCVTYNLTDNRREYLSEETYPDLPVTKAIRMSSNFPFIFERCEYNGKYYVDGGITDNFPMNYAQTTADIITNTGANKPTSTSKCLGVYNVNPTKPFNPDSNYLDLVQRLFTVFVRSMSETARILTEGSRIIELEFEFSFFNFNASNTSLIKLFDTGYDKCKELID